MRPIDADALIEVLKKSMVENPHKEEMQRAMHIHEHKYFLTLLTSFPTIEGTTFDTISRQAALEKVRTMQTYKLFEGDDMILVDKADVQTELMMLPTVQPEPQWIPVERELPEPRIDVWVNSDLGQMTGYYDEAVELWYGRDYLELIVNAWMPLPAPYQKGAKD